MSYSKRYGDIRKIACMTDCRCHLCGDTVDLDTYGQAGIYGGEAASVDHLTPQSYGGDDDPDNLRIAHQSCNSSRGVQDADEYRLMRRGTEMEPMSATAWNVTTAVAPLVAAKVCGEMFATKQADGSTKPNAGAAALGGLLTFGALLCLRAS